MAAAKKASKKKSNKKSPSQSGAGKKQLMAIIWFAIAIFLFFVVFIEGKTVWKSLHDFFFGVFGITTYFYPFLVGFMSVINALDKKSGSLTAKAVEATAVVVLISACINIFSTNETLSYWGDLTKSYTDGMSLKSGGFIGALIGHPLEALGTVPAAIIAILIIFVLLMILTGTTLKGLFGAVAKPFKKISVQATETFEEKEQQEKESDKKLKVIKGFDVDVPVDDIPKEHKKKSESPEQKQARVVSTYYDEPMPQEVLEEGLDKPEGAKDSQIMEEALEEAQKETINFKAETDSFAKELETVEKREASYNFPPLSLLKKAENHPSAAQGAELTAEHLISTLKSFGVEARVVNISRGPTVTRYELQPSAGVKISKITNLADDIALNLATAGVRIEAPIPNKAAVGIEVPNKQSEVVGVRGIFEAPEFVSAKSRLTVALGRDIGGNAVVTDLAKMPHGLIAGATGSGKSVCINSIIMSILYKATPEEVKLLMIDPKVVELGVYNGIPHLLVPVVTDPRKASGALGWAVTEMEKRYKMFADRSVRNIEGYNRFVEELGDPEIEKMPHIVIIIDELADLMMTSPKEVEDSINRIAAKARAAGMHLLVATQRPSVDVVTGVIKANIPTRIAFAVSSQVDSRTILDSAGAEKLLGRGDMLFRFAGAPKPNRIQGCFVSDSEVEDVVEFIKSKKTADYDDDIMVEIERQAAVEKKQKTGLPEDGPDEDPMLSEAIRCVVETGMASTSYLQRKLKLGYARAGRIVDQMEQRGIVGPYEGSKPRKVLITMAELLEKEAAGEE